MLLTTQQAKHWCRYLAALHTAIEAGSATLMMPVSYQCTRVSESITGCGTCYQCTKQLILRALHTSTVPPADVVTIAGLMADSVFKYVTGLDERLNDPNGLGDDFTPMTSAQFANVMDWAATQPETEILPPHSPLALWPFESESPAEYDWSGLRPCPVCTDTAPDGTICPECGGAGVAAPVRRSSRSSWVPAGAVANGEY